jgi:hypothetical protein
MIDYKLVIPSYQRSELLKDKTLKVLEKYNIPPDRVFIFVANETEKELYEHSLQGGLYTNIVVGVPKIGKQRNFIEQEYFPEGTYVVSMDDDIQKLTKLRGTKLVELDDFYTELIEKGYNEMVKRGAKTWGVYAASNPFFMKERIYTELCYIIASTYGFICERDEFLVRETEHGEDYEYSIRQFIKNGGLVRFDYITPITKYFNKGGLEEIRNDQHIYTNIRKIEKMFPKHCELYFRKNGRPELRMKKLK